MKRKYLVLLSLGAEDKKFGPQVLSKLREIDATASPEWIDSRGAGIFVFTEKTAAEIHRQCRDWDATDAQKEALRDLIVLQLGTNHCYRRESKIDAWMNAHRQESDTNYGR